MKRIIIYMALAALAGCDNGGFDPGTAKWTCKDNRVVTFECNYQPSFCSDLADTACKGGELNGNASIDKVRPKE